MIDKAKRHLKKLKDHFLPVAVIALLIVFYLYIPFIHGRLNAQEKPIEPLEPVKTASISPVIFDSPASHLREKESIADKGPFVERRKPSAPTDLSARQTASKKAVFFGEQETSEIDTEPGVKEDDAPGVEDQPESQPVEEAVKRPAPEHTYPPDITRGKTDRLEVAITFDGGYKASEAMGILNTLRARGIKTTIFLTGLFIKRHPGITRLIVFDGHEVGNHTMGHPHLTEYARTRRQKTLPWVDKKFLVTELKEAEEAFREATGKEMAPLWRAPYGEVNGELRAWAFSEGYLHIGWTFDPKTRTSLDTLDWVFDTSSRHYLTSVEIKDRILGFDRDGRGVKGGIILMHLGTDRQTDKAAAILGKMIDELGEMGYRLVKVSELIKGERALAAAAKKKAGAYDLGRVIDSGKGPS